MPVRFTSPTGDFQLLPHKRECPPLSSWNFKRGTWVLISQSNLRAGGLLFPHPAFINQGNKRAVIPTHTCTTPGHSWSYSCGRWEERRMASLPVFSSKLVFGKWNETMRQFNLGIYWTDMNFQTSQMSYTLSKWWLTPMLVFFFCLFFSLNWLIFNFLT